MPLSGSFVDANLLVLLVSGDVDTSIIAKHRRLDEYTDDDYKTLLELLYVRPDNRVLVTPNTLTEASNLLRQHREPERSLLMARFQYLIEQSEEVVIASAQASNNPAFRTAGLTDAVLLEAASAQTPVITVDSDLCSAALVKDENAAVNFRQYMAAG